MSRLFRPLLASTPVHLGVSIDNPLVGIAPPLLLILLFVLLYFASLENLGAALSSPVMLAFQPSSLFTALAAFFSVFTLSQAICLDLFLDSSAVSETVSTIHHLQYFNFSVSVFLTLLQKSTRGGRSYFGNFGDG